MNYDEKVLYLGGKYSFHHIAALNYFHKNSNLIATESFSEIIEQVALRKSDFGLIAIDNSLAGRVGDNLEKIINSGVWICGEIYLKIRLHVAAFHKTSIEKITALYSHPMAIKEASGFFTKYPYIQLIETKSTSDALKLISEKKLINAAAIGNKAAIKFYHLETLIENVDDDENNITRFFILSSKKTAYPETTARQLKASFILPAHDKVQIDLNSEFEIINPVYIKYKNKVALYFEFHFTNEEEIDNIILKMYDKHPQVKLLGIYNAGFNVCDV